MSLQCLPDFEGYVEYILVRQASGGVDTADKQVWLMFPQHVNEVVLFVDRLDFVVQIRK